MADGNRSRFGELVNRHRLRLGLSQSDVADRAFDLAQVDPEASPISVRTIQALEKRSTGLAGQRSPRISTVRTLAKALELEPGTRDHEEFIAVGSGAATEPGGTGAITAERTNAASAGFARTSEFVVEGREPHLRQLQRTIGDAANGISGVALVSAAPGTGKTWLIEEACRSMLDTHDDLVVIWTGCSNQPDVNNASRFYDRLFGMMLGDLDGIGPVERVAETNASRLRRRIPDAVDALLGHGDDLFHRVLPPRSLRNPSLTSAIDADRQQALMRAAEIARGEAASGLDITEQVFRVLHAYAASGPVVLVVEDLHWADAGVSSVLSHLAERLVDHQAPLAVIGSFRPGDLGPDSNGASHPLPPIVHDVSRRFPDLMIDLSESVGGDAGRAFVDAMAARFPGDLPPEVVDFVYEKTGGLALFVSSALGRLGDRNDTPRIVPTDHTVGIRTLLQSLPSDIDAAFNQQLGSLPASLFTLLRVASVQGNTFFAEVVMRIVEMSDGDWLHQVDQVLHEQRQLVFPGGAYDIAGQASHEYQFWHAMMRDYLYDGMTDLQRSHYHRATADAMIALYGERGHSATHSIAYHLEMAEARMRAARAWINAGDWELEHADFTSAQSHFHRVTRVIRQTENPATYAQALIGMANCARSLARPAEANEQIDRALAVAQRRHLPDVVANALSTKGMVAFDAGMMEAGARHQSEAIEQYLIAGNESEAGRSMANLGYLLHGMGRYDEAMAYARQGLDLARSIGKDSILIDATIALANCWLELGLYDDATAAYEQCRVVCDDLDDMHRDSICLVNIALASLETAQWSRGAAAVRTVLDPERATAIRLVAAAEFNMGVISEGRGDHIERIRGHYERSRSIREQTGQHAILIDSLAGLIRVALQKDDLDTAASLLCEIDDYLNDHGTDGIEHYGRLFLTLFDACRKLGRGAEASAWLGKGVDLVTGRADRLQNPEHRESYLTNVPSHRRLLELSSDHRG